VLWGREKIVTSVLEAVSRASGSPFDTVPASPDSASSNADGKSGLCSHPCSSRCSPDPPQGPCQRAPPHSRSSGRCCTARGSGNCSRETSASQPHVTTSSASTHTAPLPPFRRSNPKDPSRRWSRWHAVVSEGSGVVDCVSGRRDPSKAAGAHLYHPQLVIGRPPRQAVLAGWMHRPRHRRVQLLVFGVVVHRSVRWVCSHAPSISP